ncbi:septal ring lytic transglycosylase RlpA family protein [Oxalicibacterium solurbis]|uniref:Endolytic peptidoglycan transglycosylase RlpA n=1 Tax=Oxalicibacterium solurbis TaxID=69280 RepID=A0A8J3F7B2_9BURK|nr:septal ring lytic transglycosylase RlpA family protein [Oxalicibacterium solurbis]GGI55336.1 lipoprotein [Oxalicibacterium solurbis]
MQFRTLDAVRGWKVTLPVASCLALLLALAGCSSTPVAPSTSATSSTSSQPAARSSGSAYPALPPAGSGRGGYYLDDGPGDAIPAGLMDVPDADPRVEPYSRTGNKPYVVFGKRYVPITDDRPYSVKGYGSWYGKKFHGQKTSSGELYDMYKMTAASPVLPIPSYARVTNLSNGRQVIVRVNDRGPFRSDRVIDLSYTAALKLGYVGHGSAKLQVDRLLPADIERILAAKANAQQAAAAPEPTDIAMPAVQTMALPALQTTTVSANQAPDAQTSNAQVATALAESSPASETTAIASSEPIVPAKGFYLQFGAYSQAANAEALRARLLQNAGAPLPSLTVESSNNLYRLYSGPFASREAAAAAAAQAERDGIKPFIVQR